MIECHVSDIGNEGGISKTIWLIFFSNNPIISIGLLLLLVI
jgi:hypothetical protein